jgi:hypothetical protein
MMMVASRQFAATASPIGAESAFQIATCHFSVRERTIERFSDRHHRRSGCLAGMNVPFAPRQSVARIVVAGPASPPLIKSTTGFEYFKNL